MVNPADDARLLWTADGPLYAGQGGKGPVGENLVDPWAASPCFARLPARGERALPNPQDQPPNAIQTDE
jgi:hypothetical protein